MTHNGIEYGDMQLICEAYHLMRVGLGLSNDEMSAIFAEWNEGKLDSYLIEITRDILAYKGEDGEQVVDKVLDTAGQKGTGKWTAISALDMGIPLTLIGEAVFARFLSALKEERVAASKVLTGPAAKFDGDKAAFINDLREALYASKIISYTQGYMLMRAAAKEYGWNLNYGGIALMWRGGCIIRCCWRHTSSMKWKQRREPGGVSSRRGLRWVCRYRLCPAPWPSTTATATSACQPIFCRPSATTLARTPTSGSTGRAVSSSTPIGRARVVM
jgi:6-phosphogluconate dehydrogenase (decarboxylating)